MFNLFRKKAEIDLSRLPVHIAIIMDGNGRWASRRGLPRSAGHAAGAETFRSIATYCRDIGIQYLTVYAFSTENWKRPEQEITAIWDLLRKYLLESIQKMAKERVKIHIMGDVGAMPDDIRQLIYETERLSRTYSGIQLNICLNYGGRYEIVRAARNLAADCAAGKLQPADIDQALFESFLYSAGVPDPDLIIRPSGEHRISNFLLWQCAYSEFYFTKTLWPDFSINELNTAIAEYQRRERRFGGIKA
ncbi:MAG: isoprenyl transferase [Clostridiales bacterium]|nr:isoprenyl transferase [Clostridiales bacterium]